MFRGAYDQPSHAAGAGAGGTAGQDAGTAGTAGATGGDTTNGIGGEMAPASFPTGIQSIYTIADKSGKSNATVTVVGETVCVKGTAARIENDANGKPDYSGFWGAGLVIDFTAETATMGVDAAAAGAVGYRAELTGTLPPGLRVGANSVGSETSWQITVPVATTGSQDYDFAVRDSTSWDATDNDTTLNYDPSNLKGIAIQISTNVAAAVDFDFCVGGVEFYDASGNTVEIAAPVVDAGAPVPTP